MIFLMFLFFFFSSLHARDPFYLELPRKVSMNRKVEKMSNKIDIKGIMDIDGKCSALVCFRGKTRVIHDGDEIDQYTVIKVERATIIAKNMSGKEEIWSINTH